MENSLQFNGPIAFNCDNGNYVDDQPQAPDMHCPNVPYAGTNQEVIQYYLIPVPHLVANPGMVGITGKSNYFRLVFDHYLFDFEPVLTLYEHSNTPPDIRIKGNANARATLHSLNV